MYVDDLIVTGNDDNEISRFKLEMQSQFKMSDLGLLSFYLGIEVRQDDSSITLHQTSYAKCILELRSLAKCIPTSTPMKK